MRRLVIPLVVGLVVGLSAGPAFGQFVTDQYLGFKDTVKAPAGSIINIPIWIDTDSTVSAVSMNFTFNPNILWPQLSFDAAYDALTPPKPDSADWAGNGDPGLWYIQTQMTTAAAATWDTTNGPALGIYKMNKTVDNLDTARFLLAPLPFVTPPLPNIHKGSAMNICYLKFQINPSVPKGTATDIRVILETVDNQLSEIAQEWYAPGQGNPSDTLTVSIFPVLLNSRVIVTDSTGPLPNVNDKPILASIVPNFYNVNQGQLVSFTVSATDAEGGILKIYANRTSSLPRNASFGASGVATGAGGVASGVFSFTPDLTQQGNFVYTFEALDDSGAYSTPQVVTVTVGALERDVLYTTSAEGQLPQGGVRGLDAVLVPINIVTKKTVYGLQFDMEYDFDNFNLDSIVPSDRIPEWVVYDNVGMDPGKVRVVAFGLANDTMVAGTSSDVLYLAFTVNDYAEFGCYPLALSNAWESIDPDPGIPAFKLETDSGTICVDRWGDVNFNGFVDVDDAVGVVRYIIGHGGLNRRQFAAADIIINDSVNVVDLVGIVYSIFGWPLPSPAPILPPADQFATLKVVHDEIPSAGMQSDMAVAADMPVEVAGVQLEIQYDPAQVEMQRPQLVEGITDFGINYADNGNGTMKVLIHSWRPWNDAKLIEKGISQIIRLPFVSKSPISADDENVVRIVSAVVSDGAARSVAVGSTGPGPNLPTTFELYQNRPNPFNPTTTIDFYIDGSQGSGNVKLEVFNVLGQMVATLIDKPLAPGQYSVVWDGIDSRGQQMATGIYLYRLKVGDSSRTKKMMLLK